MHIHISILEIGNYVLGLIAFLLGRRIYGARETGLFFLGVVILAGITEHITVFLGHYNYLWHLGRDLAYFSNYNESLGGNWAWIGVLPGYFFPGWFTLCIGSYTIATVLIPDKHVFSRAALTAGQVIMFGLVVENLGFISHWYEYTSKGMTLTFWDGVWGGVYVYYFCWIGSLVLVFEKTVINKSDIGFLRGMESRLFKKYGEIRIYCFRLVVFSLLSSVIIHGFDMLALQPFVHG
jgi:hypothetical protein